jgi:hypothetical protein
MNKYYAFLSDGFRPNKQDLHLCRRSVLSHPWGNSPFEDLLETMFDFNALVKAKDSALWKIDFSQAQKLEPGEFLIVNTEIKQEFWSDSWNRCTYLKCLTQENIDTFNEVEEIKNNQKLIEDKLLKINTDLLRNQLYIDKLNTEQDIKNIKNKIREVQDSIK